MVIETLMPTTVNSVSTQNTFNPIHEPNYDHGESIFGESTSRLRAIDQKQFNKLTLLKTKAQEMLTNNEITKPVATMDSPWATALIGFALMFIIKLLSAVSKSNSPKGKKTYSHKQEPSIGYAFNAKSTTRKLTTSLVGSSYEAQVARCVRRLKQSVSGEEEEARERRDMVSRPLMQTSSTNVYDLDLIGFTESQLLYEIVESQT
ncbi:hypothetical protein Bca52824_014028 [Brassica carinata]|uniref:Uncharacterized protein n=1 Tax=Brassica carinata TaxID=52824 RepID=A0A8X8B315_BRACI|nr:hypothetical protein Bca52824_014028 [Brassica carinata]